jgi:hypothetical protein
VYVWPFDVETEYAIRQQRDVRSAPFSGIELPLGLRQRLKNNLYERLVLPEDASYAKARRIFNVAFDLFPAGIALCNSELEVALCLEGIRHYGVSFCVRASGHSFAGYSSMDDGLVIDVGGLNSIQVDPKTQTAIVGAGCKLAAVRDAVNSLGLHLPLGSGLLAVGGFMQGGGFGDTSRAHGMNSDNVLEVRVMMGDGRIISASETMNHDLWWAIRGGTGGNFGILLSVRYRLYPLVQKSQQLLWWKLGEKADRAKAARAIANLQENVLSTAPPELIAQADIRRWPDDMQDSSRSTWLRISAEYLGSSSDLATILSPLQNCGNTSFTGAIPRRGVDPFVRHGRFVSGLELADWCCLIDDFVENANLYSTLTLDALGGAINSYPIEKSSFIHRSSVFNMYATGFWIKGDREDEERVGAYLNNWSALTQPFWNEHIFQNFPSADVRDYRWNYWGKAFPALLAVKQKYDPDGLFSFPQAIEAEEGESEQVVWPPLVAGKWLKEPIHF